MLFQGNDFTLLTEVTYIITLCLLWLTPNWIYLIGQSIYRTQYLHALGSKGGWHCYCAQNCQSQGPWGLCWTALLIIFPLIALTDIQLWTAHPS